MSPGVWTLLIVVVIVLIVLAVILPARNRRRSLQRQFGPEYERAVAASPGQREAEAELSDRAHRRSALHIVPLPSGSRLAYSTQWRSVQALFVDRPVEAISQAEGLLEQVMAERGYPTSSFEEQADLISVDHPDVVQNYRIAHDVFLRSRGVPRSPDVPLDLPPDGAQLTTEELREGLLRYRSLFDELLGTDEQQAQPDAPAPSDSRRRNR